MVALLQQVDELLEEAPDLVGLLAADGHLVAADGDLRAGEGVLDLAQVLVAGTDEGSHQVRARHDDSRRCSRCRHEVKGMFTFPDHPGRRAADCAGAALRCSALIARASVAVIGDPRW